MDLISKSILIRLLLLFLHLCMFFFCWTLPFVIGCGLSNNTDLVYACIRYHSFLCICMSALCVP